MGGGGAPLICNIEELTEEGGYRDPLSKSCVCSEVVPTSVDDAFFSLGQLCYAP